MPEAGELLVQYAPAAQRPRRRLEELRGKGIDARLEDLRRDITARDLADSTREESPLRRAEDAIDIDTSALTIEQQVAFVLRCVEEKVKKDTAG